MFKSIFFSGLITLIIAVSLTSTAQSAQSPEATNPPSSEPYIIPEDDPIVAMLDSLAQLKVFRNIERQSMADSLTNKFPPYYVPQYCDSTYSARIARMNIYSPFEFVHNSVVDAFIGLYAYRRRELTERVLGLSKLYFPIFEETLDRFNLPLELKYLAVIESALNPVARSRVGATGLWQFMYPTGKMYGLQVNSFVDDRSDVYRSTVAAAEYLRDLYNIYDDWALALSAYNAGPGTVNRAIRRAGGVKDFWKIRPFLPRETQNYFPAFIAVAYVMEHASYHNLFPQPPIFTDLDIDTIKVREQLSLRTVSEMLNIPLDHLRYLNPAFRLNVIPHNPQNPYFLRIPRDFTGRFIALEDSIYNFRSPEMVRQQEMAARMEETTTHIVRSGDVLGSIARRYGTTVGEIQRLNNLRGTVIRPGQRLIVRAPARANTQIATTANTHLVRSGETLGIIAARYRVTVNDLRRWNNIQGYTIFAGQNLIVRRPANIESYNHTPENTEQQQSPNQTKTAENIVAKE